MKDAFDVSDWKETKRKLLEKDIENPSKAKARSKGWYVRKYKSPSQRSAPDDIFAKKRFDENPQVFFVEFKAPGKKPTAKQLDEHDKMREAGLIVYVCDDLAEFDNILAIEDAKREGDWA
jgi:hypothetical protein